MVSGKLDAKEGGEIWIEYLNENDIWKTRCKEDSDRYEETNTEL